MHRSRRNKKSGSNRDRKQRNQNKCDKSINDGDEKKGINDQISANAKVDKYNEKSFAIKLSDVMGRYLVTTKNIQPAEIILDEEAIVVGPCQGTKPICLVCYRPLFAKENSLIPHPNLVPCEKCNWPLCGDQSCIEVRNEPGVVHDHSEECKIFAASKENNRMVGKDPLKEHSLYEAIVPLRCLLYRDSNLQRWKAIAEMESHNAIRKMQPNIWNNNQEKVANVIRGPWGLGDKFTDDEIHTVCGALEVNAFEIGHNGSSLRALFGPYAYLIAHDCVPNTSHVDEFHLPSNGKKDSEEGNKETGIFRMKVRSSMAISCGETLFLSYAYTLQGTMARREHLRQICEGVGSRGRVLPKDPLEETSEWRCDSCGRYAVDSSSVTAIIDRITAESETLTSDAVEAYEAFLQRYRNVLHPSHYLAIGVKHSLSQLYGKISGYTIHEMPRSLLERKRNLCRELLTVFDVVEPGKSRIRGITLYELHAPLMTLITRDLEEGKLNVKKQKRELLKQLNEVLKCLEEARDILKCEPSNSPEASMAAAASEGLKGLQKWLSTIT
ncbi:uncharacterized protein [Hetaerina americana]|uniref:uncharacterized protein isoform X2 n=1 Tax=Hetaerina americana TaxID=62018 RepID=UPI003A7F1A9A